MRRPNWLPIRPLTAVSSLLEFLSYRSVLPSNAEIGAAWIGWLAIGRPFVDLTIDQEELILSSFFGRVWIFPKRNILALTRYRRRFLVGLRIHHDVPRYPHLIVFWVARAPGRKQFEALREKLGMFGYEVEESPSSLRLLVIAIMIVMAVWAILMLFR